MKKILYIGWLGYRNLGDDLLWNLFRKLASKYFRNDEVKIIPSLPNVDLSNIHTYDTVVLGGGSLLAPTYIRILYKALKLKKRIIIWGSGIDRLSETELKQIVARNSSIPLTRLNENERKMLKEIFTEATFGGVRGYYTKKALQIFGVDDAKIHVIGDPGILLQPQHKLEEKKNLIGINWGTTMNNIYGSNERKIRSHLVNSIKHLIDKGYEIMIYAVWKDDLTPCQQLYQLIDDPHHVTFHKNLYSEQDLMTQLSACTMTINFKLHPNLLSLSAHVPAIALGHRFKVFDLFHSLDLEEFVLSTSLKELEREILIKVDKVEQEHDEIINKYHEKQAIFRPLIEEPFKNTLFF